ncbi:hypothetical protein [Halomarina rubra]|uniref:Uncharacterized protein n=1 Tax=Halomarina rubra TaxID=2071873 RepID=A0ABD6ASV1_9EURY|nr:hypothetical protein [Halomarina rubra]
MSLAGRDDADDELPENYAPQHDLHTDPLFELQRAALTTLGPSGNHWEPEQRWANWAWHALGTTPGLLFLDVEADTSHEDVISGVPPRAIWCADEDTVEVRR